MKMIFDSKRINTKRQQEVDLSRGFTAIIIIICHVGLYLGNPSDVGLYTFSDIIGSEFGAPVFMTLMGTSIIYSKHQTPSDMLKRGIKLFLGGYLLSTIRTIIPYLIFGNIDEWTSRVSFFVVDILQFAGLSFMLLALFKKIKLPSWAVLIISLVMVGISQLIISLPNPIVQNETLGYFVNLFFPVTTWSCFPFFIWFFFPAFGLCFGEILIRCKNKNLMYAVLLPISLCAVSYVYFQFYKLYPNYTDYYFGGNFYYMGIKNVLLNSLFICFSLSFWHFASKIFPKIIQNYLIFLSKNLNLFYVISWVFVAAMIHLCAFYKWQFNAAAIITMMIVLLIICSLCTKAINKIKILIAARSNN